MYGCESWTVEKAECQRINAFEMWCWRRLESLLDCKEIQPVHPKQISLGCSLEGLMLKLKLQYFGHLMQNVESLERPWCSEGFGAGGEGDDRGRDGWISSPTQWTRVFVMSGSWWWTGRPGVLGFMESQRVRHDWATELTELLIIMHLA